MILGPLRDHHSLFLPWASTFSPFPVPYPSLVPLQIRWNLYPLFFLLYPLYPPGDLWVSTVARPPASELEQVNPPPAPWAQMEEHLGFGPAGLGFRRQPDLPPLWSLNIFQMDTLVQSGQSLNTYYTWQKLYPLCLSPGCFLSWELVEHSQAQLV